MQCPKLNIQFLIIEYYMIFSSNCNSSPIRQYFTWMFLLAVCRVDMC